MASVTHEQIDFILNDIKNRGVVLEDLQDNLLDHACCIVENEMPEEEDFYQFYETMLPRFFKSELKELQEETDKLLTFKDYYAMKNTLKISGTISLTLFIIGSLFKFMHWPGAGICVVLGGFTFSLIFLPLMITLKMKDEATIANKLVLSFGFFLGILMSTGAIFKIMHWPGANILMLSGIVGFTFAYVPLYFITGIKRAESKFTVTVNSILMMACGGMFFALFNLGYSQRTKNNLKTAYTFVEQNAANVHAANVHLFQATSPSAEAQEFHQLVDALYQRIQKLKSHLIAGSEGITISAADDFSIANLSHPNDFGAVNEFALSNGEFSMKALQADIDAYNSLVERMFSDSSEKKINTNSLHLDDVMLAVLLHELCQVQLHISSSDNSSLNAYGLLNQD